MDPHGDPTALNPCVLPGNVMPSRRLLARACRANVQNKGLDSRKAGKVRFLLSCRLAPVAYAYERATVNTMDDL